MEQLLNQSALDSSKMSLQPLHLPHKQLNPNRRNTTSTVHVHDTMARPDNTAIIESVAEVLFSYLEKIPSPLPTTLHPINTIPTVIVGEELTRMKKLRLNGISEDIEMENAPPPSPPPYPPPNFINEPTVQDIAAHLHNIFVTAQCSVDCTVVCLIYLERFFKLSGLKFTVKNWKTLTATSMLLASKVWDDLSMVNSDFAMFLPYTVDQINTWERQFLTGMKYDVRVSASQYAKYYFDLRARATQNRGFIFEDDGAPVDVEKAQRLEALSSAVQKRVDSFRRKGGKPEVRRAVSDQYIMGNNNSQNNNNNNNNTSNIDGSMMMTVGNNNNNTGITGTTTTADMMSVTGMDLVLETPKPKQHHGVTILD
jgi:hypothetical protein